MSYVLRSGLGLLLTSVVAAQQYTSSVVAGAAPREVVSPINYPYAVTTDLAGNVYFSDSAGVYRLDISGALSLVAGSAHSGFSGDGGPATQALLNLPSGLAVGADGAIYIADTNNNRIRKVSAEGIMTTIAGSGILSVAPDSSGDGGPATSAQLDYPSAIAVDAAGDLYIADGTGIRKVDSAGIITTAVTVGSGGALATAGRPTGIGMDATGVIYIATAPSNPSGPPDAGNVWKVCPDGTTVMLLSASASGLAVDATGDLFFADASGSRVWEVASNGEISVIAGTGAVPVSQLSQPRAVAVDTAGNLYIADSGYFQIQKLTPDGVITTLVGSGVPGSNGDGGPATEAYLRQPSGVVLGADGSLYIADAGTGLVRRISTNGIITTVASNAFPCLSSGAMGFARPQSFAVDASGNIYIADSADNRICEVSPDGTVTAVVEDLPVNGVVFDRAGNLYAFGEWAAYRVANGGYKIVAGNGIPVPVPHYCQTTCDPDNFFCVPCPPPPPTNDGGPATSASFSPGGLALDNSGNLYILDETHGSTRKVSPDGVISTMAPISGMGLAVDAVGDVFMTGYNSVQTVSPKAVITTIPGYLNLSGGIAVDAEGSVYVAALYEQSTLPPFGQILALRPAGAATH